MHSTAPPGPGRKAGLGFVFLWFFLGGILWRPTRRSAGWGLALLTLAVTPANVFMLQNAADFPSVPYWLLVARLPLQLALLALIVWSTAAPRQR